MPNPCHFQNNDQSMSQLSSGSTQVMADGDVFEKAGCSISVVYGSMPVEALAAANDRYFTPAFFSAQNVAIPHHPKRR